MWGFWWRNSIQHIGARTPTWLERRSDWRRSSQFNASFVSHQFQLVSCQNLLFYFSEINTESLGWCQHAFQQQKKQCLFHTDLGEILGVSSITRWSSIRRKISLSEWLTEPLFTQALPRDNKDKQDPNKMVDVNCLPLASILIALNQWVLKHFTAALHSKGFCEQ